MYRIIVRCYKSESENLLANSYKELKEIIRLVPIINYEIISIKKYNYNLVKDFITKKRKIEKPKGLVFGSDEPKIFREDCNTGNNENYPI